MNHGPATRRVVPRVGTPIRENIQATRDSEKTGREVVTPRPVRPDGRKMRYLPTGIATPTFRRKPVEVLPLKNTIGKSTWANTSKFLP